MLVELIITTYNKPKYLAAVLISLEGQDRLPDMVCIADDGSGEPTRAVVSAFAARNPAISVRHVWHPDDGFRKTAILNLAIRGATAEYLVFIDDDCLMHPAYLSRHIALAREGQFLTGSLIRLTVAETEPVLGNGRPVWTAQGTLVGWKAKRFREWLKSSPGPLWLMALLDRLSLVSPSWAGCNASTFRAHVLAVNGFDESMAYGGEDKEFGARLRNAGIRGRQLRYTAPLYHLEHGRSYVYPDIVRRNRERILSTRKSGKTWTESGIT